MLIGQIDLAAQGHQSGLQDDLRQTLKCQKFPQGRTRVTCGLHGLNGEKGKGGGGQNETAQRSLRIC